MINYLKQQKHITLLSHVDIDGFASQYITNEFCSKYDISTSLVNMQYGEEPVLTNNTTNSVLLVTDLHFNEEQYLKYKLLFKEVCWIDHHPSSDYDKYQDNPYIIVDTSMSATLLTATIFNTEITNIIQNVNAAHFKEGREYTYLLNKLFEMTDEEDRDYVGRLFVKRLFFRNSPYMAMADTLQHYVNIENLTLAELSTERLLSKVLEKPLFKKQGTLIIDTTNISDIADLWFSQDNQNQLMIGINFSKNSISFRSIDGKAKQLAEQLKGGGHPKAAGAKLDDNLSQQKVLNTLLDLIKDN